jgi:hypothetical protein
MRTFLVALASLIGLCPALFAQAVAPLAATSSEAATDPQAVLAEATPVKLRVSDSVNTKDVRVGQAIQLNVVEDVRVGDVVVIPTTSPATARVTATTQRTGKDGTIRATLEDVTLADGEKLIVRSTAQKPAPDPRPDVSNDGQEVTLSNGAEVTAYINGNFPVDLPKFRLANLSTGDLKIITIPGSAEISIDGRLAGVTPFNGRLTRGEHVIVLRLVGYEAWHRTVRVGLDPTAITTALKKQDGLETIPPPRAPVPSLGDLAREARAKKAAADGQRIPTEPIELIKGPEEPPPPPPQSPLRIPPPQTSQAARQPAAPAAPPAQPGQPPAQN